MRVVKSGSKRKGKLAVITDPDWTGRVKVIFDGDGGGGEREVKSYLAGEITLEQPQSACVVHRVRVWCVVCTSVCV